MPVFTWGHILGGATNGVCLSVQSKRLLAQAKIRQQHVALSVQEAIFGLQIAVDNTERMQMLQRQHQLSNVEASHILREHLLWCKRGLLCNAP